MKILLLGDFSGLHVNLAEGLKVLGQDVSVASGGDLWKDFSRDIDLRQPTKFKRIGFLLKLAKAYPNLQGYDVVQFIHSNPLATSPIFNYLFIDFIKRNNNKVFLGCNGMDHYYYTAASQGQFKYSVFQVPDLKDDPYVEYLKKGQANKHIIKQNIDLAEYSNGITACAVGYYHAYEPYFKNKTKFIPLPINTNKYPFIADRNFKSAKTIFFVGKMKGRERRKGIDKIEEILIKIQQKYPRLVDVKTVSSIPFEQYTELMNSSHILCDQMYAYSIGMNGIIAQSKGLIACGGADEEFYKLINEEDNQPIVDLNKNPMDVLETFEDLTLDRKKLIEQAYASREFVVKHHDYIKIAQQYLDFWKSKENIHR